ncbi:MAG: GFA family protein [Reyranellaceae bacterium]
MQRISGSCLCGAIRYSAETDPVFTAVCHCRNCQKQTGTASSVIVGLAAGSLSITGPIKTFHDTGDSGKAVHRRFCPACGSPIVTDVEVMPTLTFLKAGTLDDTSWLKPGMEIYCDSAQAWVPHLADTQQLPKGPA